MRNDILVYPDIINNVASTGEAFLSAVDELLVVPPDDLNTGYCRQIRRFRREIEMFLSFVHDHAQSAVRQGDHTPAGDWPGGPAFMALVALSLSGNSPPASRPVTSADLFFD
jgi:hypothetical protein